MQSCPDHLIPAFAVALQLGLLCFSLLEQPPKEGYERVPELVERRGQDCVPMTVGERSKADTLTVAASCQVDSVHMTEPQIHSQPQERKKRENSCLPLKKSKEGNVMIYSFFCRAYSSAVVYSVPYLASAVSVVALLSTTFNL